MKIPDELLADLVKSVAGSDTIRVLDILKNKKNVSEFKIAEKLDISVNQVRNMIYRLQEHNLVSFTRKKDKVKGWYIYFWTFDEPKAVSLIVDLKTKSIRIAKEELKHIDNRRLYVCDTCRKKFPEDEALELQFLCDTCGEILKEQDANKRRKDLSKKLLKDEEDLKIAAAALEEHRVLVAKATEKASVKEKVQADNEKAMKREAKKKEMSKVIKKKPMKKETKNVVVKKPTKKEVKKIIKKPVSVVKKVVQQEVVKKAEVKKVEEKKEPEKKKGFLGRVFRR